MAWESSVKRSGLYGVDPRSRFSSGAEGIERDGTEPVHHSFLLLLREPKASDIQKKTRNMVEGGYFLPILIRSRMVATKDFQ